MICKKCNNNFADTAKFCPKCGTKAQEPAAVQELQIKKCPQCGAENPIFAKFCKVDGYNFQQKQSDIKAVKSEQPRATVTPSVSKNVTANPAAYSANDKEAELPRMDKTGATKTTKIAVIAAVLFLLILAGGGSYLYFAGHLGKSPEKVATGINDELKMKGFSLYCEIDKNWAASLKGVTRSGADKNVAMNIIKAHKEIKDVIDSVQIQLSPSDVKMAIDSALRESGIRDVHAEVDDNLTVTLQGVASNENEKNSAMKIATGLGKAKDVRDNIQVQAAILQPMPAEKPVTVQRFTRQENRPKVEVTRKEDVRQNVEPPRPAGATADPAKLEGDINRAFRNAGLSSITAEVADDMSVTLKGSTVDPDHKNKAFDIAKSFNGIRKVRDRIFVVR